MWLLNAMIIAIAMYSKIPMPRVDWNEKNMRYAMCFFPLVGVIIGVLEIVAGNLITVWKGEGTFFYAVVLTLIPVFITGGIHLDGFADTMDARRPVGLVLGNDSGMHRRDFDARDPDRSRHPALDRRGQLADHAERVRRRIPDRPAVQSDRPECVHEYSGLLSPDFGRLRFRRRVHGDRSGDREPDQHRQMDLRISDRRVGRADPRRQSGLSGGYDAFDPVHERRRSADRLLCRTGQCPSPEPSFETR